MITEGFGVTSLDNITGMRKKLQTNQGWTQKKYKEVLMQLMGGVLRMGQDTQRHPSESRDFSKIAILEGLRKHFRPEI